MRVDLNPSAVSELERSQGSGSAANASQATASSLASSGDDVAHLSTGSDAVTSLRSQLDSVPDVRQQRVEAARQAISTGQFVVSPERIAAGMLAESGVAA